MDVIWDDVDAMRSHWDAFVEFRKLFDSCVEELGNPQENHKPNPCFMKTTRGFLVQFVGVPGEERIRSIHTPFGEVLLLLNDVEDKLLAISRLLVEKFNDEMGT